eukprot:scaffold12774_cov153-Isochrysis_galbana.AAC.5
MSIYSYSSESIARRVARIRSYDFSLSDSDPSRQSGMVQPVVNEMFATVHAAGSSLLDRLERQVKEELVVAHEGERICRWTCSLSRRRRSGSGGLRDFVVKTGNMFDFDWYLGTASAKVPKL